MTVKIIRKNQGAEVTDKMLAAIINAYRNSKYAHLFDYAALRQAMEGAREHNIRKIEVRTDCDNELAIEAFPNAQGEIEFKFYMYPRLSVESNNKLAEALLELGRQMK